MYLVNMKNKSLYIVSEPATLVKGSGAYRHIEVGQAYLARHFDIKLYPLCKVPSIKSKVVSNTKVDNNKENIFKKTFKRIGLWHTLKDLKILINNHRTIFKHYKAIKKINPDFIYERSNFLNYQGLIISKWLRTPHFYENNGIKYLEQSERSNSWLLPIWSFLERTAYKNSSYVFFVGLWGSRLNLTTNNWMNIENGVEQSFLDNFGTVEKKYDKIINICFIGSLMKHHGFDLFAAALKKIDTTNIHVHLFGSKLEDAETELQKYVPCTYHGFLDRMELASALQEMHIGIIPDGKQYPSFMKLFDYGAAKCLVIAPNLKNLKYWFDDNNILFFQKGNVNALRKKIDFAIKNREVIKIKGEKLYDKISGEHTWEKIFTQKSEIIKKTVAAHK